MKSKGWGKHNCPMYVIPEDVPLYVANVGPLNNPRYRNLDLLVVMQGKLHPSVYMERDA
ncbi:hypothetical protein Scep_001912 [Stephania cephalantha]|uniref:Uncharacterized protein n=1 Tax=Stephania cephalantha TaxID=152367 RepID=A0AAP0Q893_9MAGN